MSLMRYSKTYLPVTDSSSLIFMDSTIMDKRVYILHKEGYYHAVFC